MKVRDFLKNNIWKINIILAVFIAFSTCFIALRSFSGNKSSYETYSFDYNVGWLIDGSDKYIDLDNYSFKKKKNGKPYTIMKRLPYGTFANEKLMFYSRYIYFEVYRDGNLISFYDAPVPSSLGKTYKGKYSLINLGKNTSGALITIKVYPAYSDGSCIINKVHLGDPGQYVLKYLRSNVAIFIFGLLDFFLGIEMFFMLWRDAAGQKKSRASMLALSGMTISMSVWVILDSDIITVLSQLVMITQGAEIYIMIYGIASCQLFFCCFYNYRNRKLLIYVISIYFILTSFIFISARTGFRDYHENISIIIIYAFFAAAFGTGLVIKKGLDKKFDRIDFVNLAFLLMCFLIALFWKLFSFDLPVCYLLVGAIGLVAALYLIIMINFFSKEFRDNLAKAAKADTFEKMAYDDPLTGIGNRAKFYKEIFEYADRVDRGESAGVLIIYMDLNNLKLVNDMRGHNYGDLYIKSAVSVIKSVLDGKGEVFRTGGDEFVSLIPFEALPEESIELIKGRIIASLTKKEREIGKVTGLFKAISIAYGFSVYIEGRGSIHDAVHEADDNMYKKKMQMKTDSEVR